MALHNLGQEAAMFDLIAGRERHLPSHATLPIVASTFSQTLVIALVVGVPMLFVTDRLPEVPTMMAFVAAPPAPPPPPPPAVASKPKQAPKTEAAPKHAELVAPLEEPAQIAALPDDEGSDVGVPGGVEGGIPGGVVGGIVGGLPEAPPPPPPTAPAPRAPVRIGGQITQPKLIRRVEPEYPALAVKAHIQGVVILEATVGEDGDVREVKLLRSANPMLDREAVIAVQQWRYSPVVLNGIPVPFILTVTLSFYLEAPK
jgi:protein TonB